MDTKNIEKRHVRLPVNNGSFFAAMILSLLVGALWLALDHYGAPIPIVFAVMTGSILSWLVFEILIRTKFRAQIEATAQQSYSNR